MMDCKESFTKNESFILVVLEKENHMFAIFLSVFGSFAWSRQCEKYSTALPLLSIRIPETAQSPCLKAFIAL
jgi:hypothetical protein